MDTKAELTNLFLSNLDSDTYSFHFSSKDGKHHLYKNQFSTYSTEFVKDISQEFKRFSKYFKDNTGSSDGLGGVFYLNDEKCLRFTTTDKDFNLISFTVVPLKQTHDPLNDIVNNSNSKHFPNINFNSDIELSRRLIDCLKQTLGEEGVEFFDSFIDEHKSIIEQKITERKDADEIYSMPAITLIYFLAANRRFSLYKYWPFETERLELIYSDMGVSTMFFTG